MSRILGFCAAVAVGLFALPVWAAPLEAYGRLPSIEGVTLSPDGTKLGVIVTDGEHRRIAIRHLNDGKTTLLNAGPAKVRGLTWADSDHLIVGTTSTGTINGTTARRGEYMTLIDYSLSRGKARQLLGEVKNALNVAYGAPEVRQVGGRAMVFVRGIVFVNNRGQLSIFRIDPLTDEATLVSSGFANTVDWVVGPDGAPLAEAEYERGSGKWTLKVRSKGGWVEVKSMLAPVDLPDLWGLGRDGYSVLVAENGGGATALREISPSDPKWGEPFHIGPESAPIRDPASGALIGLGGQVGDELRYNFFDSLDAAAWAKVPRALKGSRVELVDWSADKSRLVVRADSPTEGPSYALVDLKARRVDPIGAVYDQLSPLDISTVRQVRYKASDNLVISGYLTTPNGREVKNLPLIVLAHGGPEARDEPGFDWWAQALASRGYAVLQANFRGSEGYGPAFRAAGYGQWGRKMQTDLSDGVRDLVGQGLVDPARVCIVGASYGGYAALAGAAFDPGVYRCAASVAGPADLRRMLAWTKERGGAPALRFWTRYMGAEDAGDPVLKDISPSEHADRISIPILLVHGKDDTVVPLAQTQVMEKALRAAGKPVELVVMKGEDHWLSRGATRLQMLQGVVAFLEKNNPPQ